MNKFKKKNISIIALFMSNSIDETTNNNKNNENENSFSFQKNRFKLISRVNIEKKQIFKKISLKKYVNCKLQK